MAIEFADEDNREIYATWHQPLLDALFGDVVDLHYDLYELTHLHRREHNGGAGDGPCTAWPSPPYRAPVWTLVADKIGARRFLEVGTAMGYTAALMADAGGPDSRIDTIEFDHDHADMAEAELHRRGLLDRVRILRGDSAEILTTLTEQYDVVFGDGGKSYEIADELRRLTRPGGVPAEVKRRLQEPLIRTLRGLRESLGRGDMPEADVLSNARDEYRSAVWAALE